MKGEITLSMLNMNLANQSKRDNEIMVGDLIKMLQEAFKENRLTFGVTESAEYLQCKSDNVMLCVLPETCDQVDDTLHIYITLIEAYCLETDIQIIKIMQNMKSKSENSKLKFENNSLLENNSLEVKKNNFESENKENQLKNNKFKLEIKKQCLKELLLNDLKCMLVEFPKRKISLIEENLLNYCRSSYDNYPIFSLEAHSKD